MPVVKSMYVVSPPPPWCASLLGESLLEPCVVVAAIHM